MHRGQLYLLLLLLLLPGLLPAQEAPAPPVVTFSGQVRLRSEFDDRRLTANELVLVHLLRSRLRATAKPLPWITVVAELQDSRFLGSGDPAQSRGTTDIAPDGLDMHQAWAQVDSVFGAPVNMRFGRQEITFANERLVGVSNWSNTGRSFDGARATLRQNGLTVDLWGARLTAPTAGPTASQNFYGLWGNWKPSSTIGVDLFGLMDDNTVKIRRGEDSGLVVLQRNTFGTLFKGTFGPVDVELEGATQMGDASANDSTTRRSIQSFLASGTVTATLHEGSKTRLAVLGTVLSGDGAAGDDKNETFNTLFGTNHRLYGTIDYLPELAGNLGLVDMSASVASAPIKGLRMLLEGHYFLPQRTVKESFGTEVDLTVWWRDVVPFEISGGVSVFMPGEPLQARIGEDTRFWAYLAGQWDF